MSTRTLLLLMLFGALLAATALSCDAARRIIEAGWRRES